MNLQFCFAVFQLVFHGDGFAGKLALLSYRDEALVLCISDGSAEDEASGLESHYGVEFQILYGIQQAVNGVCEAVRILYQRGDVPEENTGLREIRNAQHVIFKLFFFHNVLLKS